jgi:hypothetical protein
VVALTEASVQAANSADAHASSEEQLWRRRLELGVICSSGARREEPFPIGPTIVSVRQAALVVEKAELEDRLTQSQPSGKGTSEDATDEDLWKERLRLFMDSAPPSAHGPSSRTASRMPTGLDGEEDWEDFKSSLTSLLESVRASSKASREVEAPSDIKGAEGCEQEPCAHPRLCSLIALGLSISIPLVVSALPAATAGAALI